MALLFYNNTPFNSGTALDALDFGTGDGSTTTFPVINKTGTRVGSTVEFGSTEFFRNTGGVVISGNNVILNSPPINGSQGVIPGVQALVLSAFDNDSVPIVPTINSPAPRQSAQKFFIINMDDIAIKQHNAAPSSNGINVFFADNISNVGPNLSWVQLACADPVTGAMMTPLATGVTLKLPPISAFSPLASSISAGQPLIYVVAASGFTPGAYCLLNPGQVNQEEVHVTAVNTSTNILTIDSNLNFAHTTSENIYHNGWAAWALMTVPVNATNNTAQNYYNLGLERQCITIQRP